MTSVFAPLLTDFSCVQTAVGATLGMALVLRGGGSVIWSKSQDNFPYIKGMLVIFLSWVCSPISAGGRLLAAVD
jgi:solute carrier family 20 (sodium-dependent phosphate transporter)